VRYWWVPWLRHCGRARPPATSDLFGCPSRNRRRSRRGSGPPALTTPLVADELRRHRKVAAALIFSTVKGLAGGDADFGIDFNVRSSCRAFSSHVPQGQPSPADSCGAFCRLRLSPSSPFTRQWSNPARWLSGSTSMGRLAPPWLPVRWGFLFACGCRYSWLAFSRTSDSPRSPAPNESGAFLCPFKAYGAARATKPRGPDDEPSNTRRKRSGAQSRSGSMQRTPTKWARWCLGRQ